MQLCNAIKKYMFPFAYKFFDTLDDSIPNIISNVESLHRIFKDSKNLDEHIDAQIFYARFHHSVHITGPFYRWYHESNSRDIQNLLSGETVFLIAHIRKGVELNAIKFKEISLNISCNDQQINRYLHNS